MSRAVALCAALLVCLPGTGSAQTGSFESPAVRGVRLDWCKHFGRECGKPAADLFCREQGFAEAARFVIDEGIGARGVPTLVFGDGRLCQDPRCSGFRAITCVGSAGVPPPAVQVPGPQQMRPLPPPQLPPPPPPVYTPGPQQMRPPPPQLPPPPPPVYTPGPQEVRPVPEPRLPPPPPPAGPGRPTGPIAAPGGPPPGINCRANPEFCCPDLQKTTACRELAETLLDVRIRSYVPPRFTVMGKHDPLGPNASLANLVSDTTLGGPHPVWPGCRYSPTAARNAIRNDQDLWEQTVILAEAMVGQWASGYEAAQAFVSDAVAEGVCSAVDDSASCRSQVASVVKTAIRAGLVSLGIPPEIPDLQQLRAHGIDYLAAEAASQVLGEADEILEGLPLSADQREALYLKAYDETRAALTAQLDQALPALHVDEANPLSWGHLEPAYAPHNARVYVELRVKPGLEPAYQRLLRARPRHRWPPLYLHDEQGVFRSVGPIAVPSFLPAGGLVLPLELAPSRGPADAGDRAATGIPGTPISRAWLRDSFGLEEGDLVRSQYNYRPLVADLYIGSEYDLFYATTRAYSFRLMSAFGSEGAVDWVAGLSARTGTVWDAETGVGVRTGPAWQRNNQMKPYYGRIDPAPRCDGKPTLASFQ